MPLALGCTLTCAIVFGARRHLPFLCLFFCSLLPSHSSGTPLYSSQALGINTPTATAAKTSFKDALRRSSQEEVLATGRLLKEIKGVVYFGEAAVSEPTGDEVIEEAVGRIQAAAKPLPQKALLAVYQNTLEIQFGSSSTPAIEIRIKDISALKLGGESKASLGLIQHSRRLDKMACHLMQLPAAAATGTPSVRQLIVAAQEALYSAAGGGSGGSGGSGGGRKGSTSSDGSRGTSPDPAFARASEGGGGDGAGSASNTGQLIGNFEGSYLGTENVAEPAGQDIAEAAVTACLAGKPEPTGVFLQVSTEGLFIIDALTYEREDFVLADVSFSSVCGKAQDYFVFFQKDEALKLYACHVFKGAGERTFDMAAAVGQAFKAFAAQLKSVGGDPFQAQTGGKSGLPSKSMPPSLLKRQVRRSELTALRPIGAGQFGQVYLAEQATGAGAGAGSTVRRAVKLLRSDANPEDYEDFVGETEVMLLLSHDNLVGLVGVTVQQRPWMMILEYCALGDLRRVLKGCSAKGVVLDFAEQLRIATQIANAMEYMSHVRVIHMDLAARNVLVGAENQCKVADFGMSKRLADGEQTWSSPGVLQLAVKWCAPEVLAMRVFSAQSDVWAFGVTLWEVASYGLTPYTGVKPNQIQRRVREGLRLTQPKGCSKEYFAVMQRCFAAEPADRPLFTEINTELKTYLRNANTGRPRDLAALLHNT